MSVIEELDELQRQDGVIRDLAQQARDLPLRRRQETDRVDGIELQLQEARQSVESGGRHIRDLEAAIADHKANVEKWEKQRQGLRTNEEFRAIGQQIDRERRFQREDEERLERARALVAAAEETVASAEIRCEEAKSSIAAYVASLDLQLAETQKKLIAAQEERAAKVAPLDVPEKRKFLRYYERLSKKCWPAVLHVSGGNVCPGCHMTLPPSKMQDAQRNAMLEDDPAQMKTIACDYCGRLIFKKK